MDIATNNVHIGNAGMLPRISADVSTAAGIQNTTQTLLSGETRSLRGAENRSLAYGAQLNWTLFDGLQMFTRYEQLKQIQQMGEAQFQADVLRIVHDVISNYYGLVQQKQLIEATESALELSAFRLRTAQSRYEIGRAAKLEVLAAQVDHNTDTTQLLRQKNELRDLEISLNELLSRDIQTEFEVADTISIRTDLVYPDLLTSAQTINPTLQTAMLNQRIQQLELRRIRGERYPTVNLSTAYTRSRSETELGFSTSSRANGLNVGLSASMNIFNGLQQRRNERNAQTQVDIAAIQVEQISKNLEAQLRSAYQTYLMNLELVRLDNKNLRIARENLDITLEKFKLGSIAPVEFREAQRNYVDAATRYHAAQYEAKLAEISLLQISGTLAIKY